jgi:hypothetical protein
MRNGFARTSSGPNLVVGGQRIAARGCERYESGAGMKSDVRMRLVTTTSAM